MSRRECDGQLDLFAELDQDEPGALCRYSNVKVEGKWHVPEPKDGGWVGPNEYVCWCKRTVHVRTDGKLPRHYVPHCVPLRGEHSARRRRDPGPGASA